ncbi:MAG TPA: hypothetical protein PKA58_12255 [Polyangium sp.]|jgi:hypothetical protein|nr:hypothetical protein [Polyangium sp.]
MHDDKNMDVVVRDKVLGRYDEENKIIEFFCMKQAELTLEDGRACSAWVDKTTGGVARPMLCDFTNMKSQTKECRDYFSKDPNHLRVYSAVALLVKDPLSRMIANFFVGINKPPKPTRLFDVRAKAVEWLLEQDRAQQ